MNLFRLCADLMHLASIFIILIQIYGTKSCAGLSFQTQVIYSIVFCCRYLDLFWNFWSMYNWILKVVFIFTSLLVCYWMKMRKPYCLTYEKKEDTFRGWILLIPTFILACVWNVQFTPFEILWAFSIYLEAVAIFPQLVMIQKFAKEHSGSVKSITSHYVFCLGMYRGLYLINWIYRYLTEKHYWDPIAWAAGTVQTCLYLDFFYYYIKARYTDSIMTLPV